MVLGKLDSTFVGLTCGYSQVTFIWRIGCVEYSKLVSPPWLIPLVKQLEQLGDWLGLCLSM